MDQPANRPNEIDTYEKLDLRAEPARGPRQPTIAPGAVRSPQVPGQVPDRSSVPGQYAVRFAAAPNAPKPLTEQGTAQGILRLFQPKPGQELKPEDFEQAPPSYEEQRKAYLNLLPPVRPMPGEPIAEIEANENEELNFLLPGGSVTEKEQ